MDTQIVVTTLTISGSLGAAVVALIQSTRAQRVAEAARIELERFQAAQANRKRAAELAFDEAEPLEQAISKAWGDIQKLKDILLGLLSPALSSVPLALAEVEDVAAALSEGYVQFGSLIPDEASNAWHKAKNAAQHLAIGLGTLGKGVKWGTELPAEFRASICHLKEALTDAQLLLANGRRLIRGVKLNEILKLL